MGKCIHCGGKAGLFKKECPSCKQRIKDEKRKLEEKRIAAGSQIGDILGEFYNNNCSFDPTTKIEAIYKDAQLNGLPKDLYIQSWEHTLDHYTEDSFLDNKEIKNLDNAQRILGISNDDLSESAMLRRTIFILLAEYVNTKDLPDTKGNFPYVKFMKSEAPFFSVDNMDYYEESIRTHFEGGSTGYSFRVAKGFWLRQSAFKGRPISEEYTKFIDTGELILTNKHIYFSGSKRAFRIKLEKIVSIVPFGNGIQILKDAASAKPQFFENQDASINEVFCQVLAILHDN